MAAGLASALAGVEQAGIDLVCDGELYRFDVNHPQTNGMIEYFVRPMQGVRYSLSFDEVLADLQAGAARMSAAMEGGTKSVEAGTALARQAAADRPGAGQTPNRNGQRTDRLRQANRPYMRPVVLGPQSGEDRGRNVVGVAKRREDVCS